jgi:heme/copper-type cytochrome/quinol oxidase subunit 2
MSNEIPATQERKLKSLRRILLFCFAGISIPLTVMGAFVYFILINRIHYGQLGRDQGLSALVYLPWIGMVVVAFVVGVICLVVYYVFKYRLERDDELFL